MKFKKLPKLHKGDKVAILSPSFGAPGMWPEVYELGLQRLRDVFELEPVEYPTTRQIGASAEDRSRDLIDAFEDKDIKAVITTIGGDDQVTYVKNLPREPFADNPMPYLGFSDNSHFMNHLWLSGVPSYYGGALFTQFARGGGMDDFTVKYLKAALFEETTLQLGASDVYNDVGLDWGDLANLNKKRAYEDNDGWYWDGDTNVEGITWGGCVESLDEILRHGVPLPSVEDLRGSILFFETSEEQPSADYVRRVFRALGEQGILGVASAVLVGRPKAWERDHQRTTDEKAAYRKEQRETILTAVRAYNKDCPIIQNMDFGHTDPQICLPMGRTAKIDSQKQSIEIEF